MVSDYSIKIKSAINEVGKARNESEVYKYLIEALVKHFDFNRATVRKVSWERGTLSLVCYLGFNEEVPSFDLPLSEEAGAFGKVALRGEPIAVFQGEKVPSDLKLPPRFANLQRVMHSNSFLVVPIKIKGEVKAVFGVDRKTSGKGVTPEDKEALDLLSEMVGKILEGILTQEELNTTLVRDELTGLFNRRYFIRRLDEEYERAKRYNIPLSCCIFDIDDFKLINDTYGHIFGDQVLRQVGRLTEAVVRYSDIVTRYGGEEFTVLFTHTSLENAIIAAERIRRVISSLIFPYNGKEVQVTATFGISNYPDSSPLNSQELLHHADMALYEGKKKYRGNCIVVFSKNTYTRVRP